MKSVMTAIVRRTGCRYNSRGGGKSYGGPSKGGYGGGGMGNRGDFQQDPGMGMYGGKGMKGAPDMGMDMYGGKGMKGAPDMYGGKGMPPGMDMYGGKGGKGAPDMGMDMYGGKGGKGMAPDMGMYGGKGKGMPPGMDMYGGKGGAPDMGMYGGKGGMKGAPDMEMYRGKGGKGMGMPPPDMEMYGGKGGKGMPPGMDMGGKGASMPLDKMQLDFAYPCGDTPVLGMFDVRDMVCKPYGFVHGQKLRVTNPENPKEMFEMVVVGVGRHPESSETGMWFHVAGEPGAGIFDSEMLDAYRQFMEVCGKVKLNPLSATEQQQLKEHAKMVHTIERSKMNIECFHAWRMAKSLRKTWQPPTVKDFPWPTECTFGFPMSTGDPTVPPAFCKFDKRSEALAVFTVQDGIKVQHGMTLVFSDKEGKEANYTVIGSRPMPGVKCILWAEKEGETGAQPISIRNLSKARIANVAPVAVKEADVKDFAESEPEVIIEQFEEFEMFVMRAERAVVRKIKPKKSKKSTKAKEANDEKKEGNKEESK